VNPRNYGKKMGAFAGINMSTTQGHAPVDFAELLFQFADQLLDKFDGAPIRRDAH
jgi:hypothetical protein